MRIEYVYRFPVKGLTAEAMEVAQVEAGEAIPWDRAFALAQGDAPFDPARPEFLPKQNFMCLMRNARIARLRATFEPRTGMLSILAPDGMGISENALSEAGRQRIGAFLAGFLGDEARGTPHFHYVPGHSFCDQRTKVISLINLASLCDYEAKVGGRRHRRRFRANVWFTGAPAWSEFDWVGREIQLGGAVLRVVKRTERDIDPLAELRQLYGHTDLGIHAEVVEGGRFAVGDGVEVLPA
jgi:uncharacterized protein YcbX